MALELIEGRTTQTAGNVISMTITGKLEKEDYGIFVPEMERLIQEHGKIRLLMALVDFEGWSAGAAWEDTKFGVRHFNDLERLGIVGDRTWEKGMALFCKVFTTAKVRYFDHDELEEAKRWIREEA